VEPDNDANHRLIRRRTRTATNIVRENRCLSKTTGGKSLVAVLNSKLAKQATEKISTICSELDDRPFFANGEVKEIEP